MKRAIDFPVHPLPPRPYGWLSEERLDACRILRQCRVCGEAMEAQGERRGRITVYPGFVQWYRDHRACGSEWKGHERFSDERA